MGANDRVALAGRRFQSFAVPHGDPPMRVADQASLLQRGGGDAHGRAAYTEHHREKFMAEIEVVLLHSVVRHQ